ncbi:MAG: putative phosphoesterase [Chthonomonadaceae bacterium]|nr:putative phosphoesterase [Chthonomonadaceae bacterium]
MRTALISDIHGNFDGLLAVLNDTALLKCDRVVCLGDLVDGGPRGPEVMQLVRDLAMPTVQGNHDEWPDTILPWDAKKYLRSLPEEIVEGDILFTHTSPRRKKDKIKDPIEAWNVFEESSYRRIFVGDIHIPLLYGQKCAQQVSATSYPISYDHEFAMDPDDRYIVCVGAVGYSRDGLDIMRYAIYDHTRDTVLFRAVPGPILKF